GGWLVWAGGGPGAGAPNRRVFGGPAAGHEAVGIWLSEPVEHVREGRSLLLLKLVFAQRNCIDSRPLLLAQREAIEEAIASLEERTQGSDGRDAILLRFRLESSRAVERFVEGVLSELEPQARAV